MSKVTLRGYIIVPEIDLELVVSELPNHCTLTLQEPGCLKFSVTQDKHNPLRFDVFEEFIDASAFETHQRRVKASQWGIISKNAKRHYSVTEE